MRSTILLGLLGSALAPIAAGCAGLRSQPNVSEVIATITAETVRPRLEELLALGPRPASDVTVQGEVRSWLGAQLVSWGYTVREEHFSAPVHRLLRVEGEWTIARETMPQTNLIAERLGRTRPDEVVEVCAHVDTFLNSPGADDNGSGVIGALEIARALAGLDLERTVRFCFFAAEEDGTFGSIHHVERIGAGEEGTIVGLINFEMIGYTDDAPGSQSTPLGIGWLIGAPSAGNFIAVVGSSASSDLGKLVVAALEGYVPELPVFGLPRMGSWFPDSYRSDHAAYWRAELPAVMLTDTANFRNPHYHRDTDTLETLDLDFLARVARGTAAAVIHRAGADHAESWPDSSPPTEEP